jgi:hypothetical protein
MRRRETRAPRHSCPVGRAGLSRSRCAHREPDYSRDNPTRAPNIGRRQQSRFSVALKLLQGQHAACSPSLAVKFLQVRQNRRIAASH